MPDGPPADLDSAPQAGISFAELPARDRYNLLCAVVVPRPIALVTTRGPDGVVNAAPFSFFNVFGEEPPVIVLGLQHKPEGSPKDTTRNIAATGVLVVNLVDEALAEAMNVCAVDFPPEVSEIEAAGLELLPGIDVPVPRIAAAPFALECRRKIALQFGPDREIMIGEVLRLHARPELLQPGRLRVVSESYHPVGRLFGTGYARQRDRFDLARQSYAEWLARDRG